MTQVYEWTPNAKMDLLKRYVYGNKTIHGLAEEMGVSWQEACKVLRSMGVNTRKRAELRMKKKEKKVCPTCKQEIR